MMSRTGLSSKGVTAHDRSRRSPFDPHLDRIGRGHALVSSVDLIGYCRTVGESSYQVCSGDYGYDGERPDYTGRGADADADLDIAAADESGDGDENAFEGDGAGDPADPDSSRLGRDYSFDEAGLAVYVLLDYIDRGVRYLIDG